MYLSQLLGSKIKDSSDKAVGKVKDALVKSESGNYAPIEYLLMRQKGTGKDFFIPYQYVANTGTGEVTLRHMFSKIPDQPLTKPEEYVYLERDVLDEQIVDVDGARVVRVNDLRIGLYENKTSVLGIDVSFKGILRRLHLDKFDLIDIFKVNLIDLRKTQLVKGSLQLDTISKDLTKLHPADLANIVEDLTIKQGSRLVDSLDSKSAAHVVEEMDPAVQKMIIHYLGPEKAAGIVEQMSVDETVDLLRMLPATEAHQFLAAIRNSKSKKIENLLHYDDNTAGGLMTPEYLHAKRGWTVGETIEEIRKVSKKFRSLLYVYITDEEDKFLGTVSLRNLMLTDPAKKLGQVMKVVPDGSILRAEQNINDIMKVMTKYNLFTAAVLDRDHKMVGIVTIDDVMRHMVPHA
jgi:magnesium transporter